MTGTQTTNGLASLLEYISLLEDEEIGDIQAFGQDGHVDEELDDESLARFLFAQEAASLLAMSRDRRMDLPTLSDGDLLDELTAVEDMARFDHEMALALFENRPLPTRPAPDSHPAGSNQRGNVANNVRYGPPFLYLIVLDTKSKL